MGMDRFLTAEEAAKLTKGVEAQVYKLCQRIKIEAKKGNTSVEVYDLDNEDEIQFVLENTKFPNWCISPCVMIIEGKDVGEWSDDHPLNGTNTVEGEYNKLFGGSSKGEDACCQ